MQSIEEIERICYQSELDRAERYMNDTYGDDEPDPEECPGHELGECWSCPHEAECFGE